MVRAYQCTAGRDFAARRGPIGDQRLRGAASEGFVFLKEQWVAKS